jgi:hypothetical protein
MYARLSRSRQSTSRPAQQRRRELVDVTSHGSRAGARAGGGGGGVASNLAALGAAGGAEIERAACWFLRSAPDVRAPGGARFRE